MCSLLRRLPDLVLVPDVDLTVVLTVILDVDLSGILVLDLMLTFNVLMLVEDERFNVGDAATEQILVHHKCGLL